MRGRPRRVLLVEADPQSRAALIDRLASADMDVRTATAAGGVRAALAEGWPEVVVVGPSSRRQEALMVACATARMPMLALGDAGDALAEVARVVG